MFIISRTGIHYRHRGKRSIFHCLGRIVIQKKSAILSVHAAGAERREDRANAEIQGGDRVLDPPQTILAHRRTGAVQPDQLAASMPSVMPPFWLSSPLSYFGCSIFNG